MKLEKYTREWCDTKKKTCQDCLKTYYYCKRHTPRVTRKSSRTWCGMNHQEKCKLLARLQNKEKEAVEIYIDEVRKQVVSKNFVSWSIECPQCKGWDIEVSNEY